MSRPVGSSCWIDCNTQSPERTIPFYEGLFGWTFTDTGEDFASYRIIHNQGAVVGGFMDVSGMTCPAGDPLPAMWDVYLAVEDADARVKLAVENGGQLLMGPDDAGTAGRFAIVLDAAGSNVSMWQAGETEGYEFTGRPGSPVWFELMTHHYDKAAEFYTAVFEANLMPMGDDLQEDCEAFRYSTNGAGDQATWGLGDATGMMPQEATGWRVYFGVASSEEAIRKVTELGGTVLDGPQPSPFGTIATVADPDGATFQICAMSESVHEPALGS